MKKIILSIIPLVTAVSLHADTLFSENFDSYTQSTDSGVTNPLVGQGTWLQLSTSVVNPVFVDSTSAASLRNNGQDIASNFSANSAATTYTPVSGDTITTTMTINLSAVQTAGDYFSMLGTVSSNSSLYYQRVFAKSDGAGGFVLGVLGSSLPTGGVVPYGTTGLTLGTAYTLTINWHIVDGPTNDTFDILVNGMNYLMGAAWTSTTAEPTVLGSFDLRQGSAANAPTLTVDNVSVLTVPEPSTLSALALSGGFLLFRRRRSAAVVS